MRRGAPLLAFAVAVLWLAAMVVHLARQELPTARLRGRAVAEETGRPLPGAEIRLRLIAPHYESVPAEYAFITDRSGAFASRRLPAGAYELQAASRAHQLRATKITLREGQLLRLNLELAPVPPFFHLALHQKVFTPDETPRITARGFVRGDSVDFRIYRVDPGLLFERYRGRLHGLLHAEAPPYHLRLDDNPGLSMVSRTSGRITERDIEGIFRQRFDLPITEPGIYVVAARADSILQTESLMVTRLGLVVKQWGREALAYAADLRSGEPVAGAAVTLAVEGAPAVSGKTDESGLLRLRMPGAAAWVEYLARAEHEGSLTYLTGYAWAGEDEQQHRVYVYTDRPIYRPGHTVRFNAIARRFADADYAVPAAAPVQVKVWDPRETLVYAANLATDDFGAYHGRFDLSDEAATGDYRLQSRIGETEDTSYFSVAEYRKPEYSVEVTTDKRRYLLGDTIRARIAAQYYFGAPVAGAEVQYLVRRSPHYFAPGFEADEYGEDHYDGDYYGEVIEEGEARTDADGIAAVRVRTRPPALEGRDERTTDFRYTIEATVTDPSRMSVTAEASALVTRGEFALLLEPRTYIAEPGQPAEVEVRAARYDGKPVRSVRVTVAAGPEIWQAGRSTYQVESRSTVTTDAEGQARLRFTPRTQAAYRVQAEARDRRGNRIRAATYLWVTGEAFADLRTPYPKLEIVTDKREYQEGETATVLINTEAKGATALLTVEGPRLYEHRLVELRANSTRVEVAVRPEYRGNFFIAVTLVRDKQFLRADKRVPVSTGRRQLKLEVTPDKDRYAPGEQATYRLKATDWQGRPAAAALSIGVVDESIYALQEETTTPIADFFYPPRPNLVSTVHSFPDIYLDADKAAGEIAVRRRFPDTAYWNPAVRTDAQGVATVSLTMPDTLTTWRATVRGVTLATEVGQAVSKVISTKPLFVRLQAPRFMVQGDALTVSALAHNYSGAAQQLEAWLEAPGLDLTQAQGRRRFSLADEGTRRLDYRVAVPAPGDHETTAYVKAGSGLADAMALTIPALPYGRERVEWRSGAAAPAAVERLTLRADAIAGAGDLRVRLAPSIASVLLGALEYLAAYPYGCTEQTMSAFLPDVVVARTLRELEVPSPELERKLPDMVRKGLDRLYNFQHDDGGWGWWRYDQSDPWMTAYVVQGLLIAREAGFAVNEQVLDRGLQWLLGRAQAQPAPTAERVFTIYVLSLADKNGVVDRWLTQLHRAQARLDAREQALLMLTATQRGRRAEARAAAQFLWRQMRETQALGWWTRGQAGHWGRGDDVETTALALKALLAVEPDDPRLPKVVRWLVLNRDGDHWVSTRDTAWALFALTDFLKHSQELRPDYTATVTLNDAPLLTRRFTRDDLFAPEVEIKVPGASLRAGENVLRVAREGQGSLYYTAILRQYVGGKDLAKVITGAGITVERSYHRMVSRRDPATGVITVLPAERPTTALRSGEAVLVRLTVTSRQQQEYIVIEDPLPAGCEASERGRLDPWEWDRWWSDMDLRDEKVAIFARRLPAGASTIEYHLRSVIPGDYHALPTEVYSMYNPEVRGSGAAAKVTVR